MQNQETENNNTQIIEPSTLAAFGLHIVETMTTPSRPRKKPRPVWVVTGNVFGLEDSFRSIGGRKFRGSWSFFEDPRSALLEMLSTQKRMSYAEQVQSSLQRKLDRSEKYETYAANAEARAESSARKVSAINSFIPLGQPILVGHHSERRHRRDLLRMEQGMRKSIKESEKAEYFADKATSLARAESKLKSRRFVGNRINDAKREIAQLSKWAEASHPRLLQAQEKLEYWQSSLKEIEAQQSSQGLTIASPETIKPGDLVYYIGSWLPVVRVNKKTVTVSHWLGIPKFTYKIEYTRISEFKSKPLD